MAETVKKSRIVSEELLCENLLDDSSSLQDIINEEFNQRLKSMSNEELDNNHENVSPTIEKEVLKNGHSKNGDLNRINSSNEDLTETNVLISPTENVLTETESKPEQEIFATEKTNGQKIIENLSDPECDSYMNDENLGLESSPEEEIILPKVSAKERFLSTVPDIEETDTKISATAKDRLFLASDDACMFFNHRVVQSPMLTPTEENYDFLQGLSDNNISPPETNSPKENLFGNENFNQHYADQQENDSITEKFDKLNLYDDSLQNIQNITSEFLENERKSAENSFEKSEESFCEVDGEIPMVKVTEVTPELSEKDSFEENERSINNIDEFPQDYDSFEQNEAKIQETQEEEELLHKTSEPIQENEKIVEHIENFEVMNTEDFKKSEIVEEEIVDFEKSEIVEENSEIFEEEPKEIPVEEKCDNKNEPIIEKITSPKKSMTNSFDMGSELKTEVNGIFDIVRKNKELFEEKAHQKEDNFVPKSYNLIKRLDVSPSKTNEDDDEVFETNTNNVFSTSTTSESSFMETTTESKSTQDKVLKKKKSKKSKKDNEKENISVSDFNNTNDEDCLSHVSVRTLCRSFSDLTTINDCRTNIKVNLHQKAGRTKSLSDIRRDSCSNHIENVFGGVSVKQLKSSFSKFDALQKKSAVLHVRSSEASKAPEKFNGSTPIVDASNCKACSKQVFQMEQIKAEKAIWHKNCFRCKECNKQLTVDTYQSNEGVLYCKPHFKSLFAPKVVEDTQPIRPRKHEMIIRENQPEELPPDVVRASDKPDLGLEELQNLNVKERFQVFQHQNENENGLERTPSAVNVKRSPSILSKLARFQQKGMDIGVNDESLNGVPLEESSSESEEEDDGITGEDADLIRAKRAQREKPLHFNNMSEVMSKWESGNQMNKEDRREERKQEIQSIRSRLFMGKQAKIKEMYQQAVADSESGANVKKHVATEICENAKMIKEQFEKGEVLSHEDEHQLKETEDMSVFESGISKKSRSIFLEMDANAAKSPQMIPVTPVKSMSDVRRVREAYSSRQVSSEDVVRCTDKIDDVAIETKDISNKFKFFETYKEPEKEKKRFRITPPREGQAKASSPDREIYHDPNIIRAEEQLDDSEVVQKSHTATKMLSIFRQMEENINKDPSPTGPKPLKRFTPPPEPLKDDESSGEEDSATEGEESEEESDHDEYAKLKDDDLIEAQKAARAKQLRAKFEKWEANEIQREQSSVNIAEEIGDDSQVESAKSLRARFESMRDVHTNKDRPKVKVNRFVDTTNNVEICKSCKGRVYPLEKISCHNNIYHKNCFRCRECNCVLRMDSYTYNQGLLYCTPHFKRLFISKGNYESGFGLGQHKEKWNTLA